MSAYSVTLRALVANLFGLKPASPPAAGTIDTFVLPHPSDEQLTVPGYYVSSVHKPAWAVEAPTEALPDTAPRPDERAVTLTAAAGSPRQPSPPSTQGARTRVSSPG